MLLFSPFFFRSPERCGGGTAPFLRSMLLLLLPFFAWTALAGRYISTAPNLTEILFEIGAGEEVVGRSTACDWPPQAREIPAVGPFGFPDPEKSLKQRPTRIFTTQLVDPKAHPWFSKAHIPVTEIPCDRLSDIPAAIETLGFWTGREREARARAEAMRRTFEKTRGRGKSARTVLPLLDITQPFTAGKGSLISDLLNHMGVRNWGDLDNRPYFMTDLQAIAHREPDVILCLFAVKGEGPERLFREKIGWKDLRAVKEGRVYTLPHLDFIMRPGPRITRGINELGNLLEDDLLRSRAPSAQDGGVSLIRELTLSRIVTALLVGCALALAGCIFQTLLRNPLADPYILGVSSGASLGAAAWIALGGIALYPAGLPLLSFAAAALSLLLVIRVSRLAGSSSQTLILSGVMVSAIESSLLLLILTFSDPYELQGITWWMLGNLQGNSWTVIASCGAAILLSALILMLRTNKLDALMLGEGFATTLGVNLKREYTLLLAAATLATASAVALAGIIGFIGLMIPHLVRLLAGAGHRRLLPLSALTGALFLLLCDQLCRWILPSGTLPVGVVTALTGGPFFLFLLISSSRKQPC